MHPLDDRAIHELLFIYVARGKHTLMQDGSASVDSNEKLTSLAYSDAVNTLIPCRRVESNKRAASPFCVIKNARGLCQQDGGLSAQNESSYATELQQFADADIVFVEVSLTELKVLGTELISWWFSISARLFQPALGLPDESLTRRRTSRQMRFWRCSARLAYGAPVLVTIFLPTRIYANGTLPSRYASDAYCRLCPLYLHLLCIH